MGNMTHFQVWEDRMKFVMRQRRGVRAAAAGTVLAMGASLMLAGVVPAGAATVDIKCNGAKKNSNGYTNSWTSTAPSTMYVGDPAGPISATSSVLTPGDEASALWWTGARW